MSPSILRLVVPSASPIPCSWDESARSHTGWIHLSPSALPCLLLSSFGSAPPQVVGLYRMLVFLLPDFDLMFFGRRKPEARTCTVERWTHTICCKGQRSYLLTTGTRWINRYYWVIFLFFTAAWDETIAQSPTLSASDRFRLTENRRQLEEQGKQGKLTPPLRLSRNAVRRVWPVSLR